MPGLLATMLSSSSVSPSLNYGSFLDAFLLSPPCSCSRVCFDCIVNNLEPGNAWAGTCSNCHVPYTRSISSNKQARILAQIAYDAGHDVKVGLSCVPPGLFQTQAQVLSAADDSTILSNARDVFTERMEKLTKEISLCRAQPGRETVGGLDSIPIQQLCRKIPGRVQNVLDRYQERVPSTWTEPVVRGEDSDEDDH